MIRKHVGRLLIVVAGGGCVVMLFFVVLPMMNEPAPSMTQDEIVAEVLGSDEVPDDEGEIEAMMPVPSPLVGVRNDGEEVSVVFPDSEAAAAESPVNDNGLPQILRADDMAAAMAALEAREAGSDVPVEALPVEARETGGPVGADRSEGMPVVPPEPGTPAPAMPGAEEMVPDDVEPGEPGTTEEPEQEAETVTLVQAVAVDRVPDQRGGAEGPATPAVRRSEFDMPVSLDSRAPREVPHPSGGVPEFTASEAAQAGNPESGLPPRTGVIVPGTLRGVMGYRLPLVSRQEVPDQIVSGVLIPAHTTFVILKEGSWELVDVTPEELELLKETATAREAPSAEGEPVRKGWNPLRIFRKREAPADE